MPVVGSAQWDRKNSWRTNNLWWWMEISCMRLVWENSQLSWLDQSNKISFNMSNRANLVSLVRKQSDWMEFEEQLINIKKSGLCWEIKKKICLNLADQPWYTIKLKDGSKTIAINSKPLQLTTPCFQGSNCNFFTSRSSTTFPHSILPLSKQWQKISSRKSDPSISQNISFLFDPFKKKCLTRVYHHFRI